MTEQYLLPRCVGCRVCEMVCGYHHAGTFNYAHSSIQTKKTPSGFTIRFCGLEGTHEPCDSCAELDQPLCVQYCPEMRGQAALEAFLNGKLLKDATSDAEER